MVNLNKIKEIAPLIGGTYLLTMSNGSQVEVSRRQAKRLLDLLKRIGEIRGFYFRHEFSRVVPQHLPELGEIMGKIQIREQIRRLTGLWIMEV